MLMAWNSSNGAKESLLVSLFLVLPRRKDFNATAAASSEEEEESTSDVSPVGLCVVFVVILLMGK
jgi:hypothetical protein